MIELATSSKIPSHPVSLHPATGPDVLSSSGALLPLARHGNHGNQLRFARDRRATADVVSSRDDCIKMALWLPSPPPGRSERTSGDVSAALKSDMTAGGGGGEAPWRHLPAERRPTALDVQARPPLVAEKQARTTQREGFWDTRGVVC